MQVALMESHNPPYLVLIGLGCVLFMMLLHGWQYWLGL